MCPLQKQMILDVEQFVFILCAIYLTAFAFANVKKSCDIRAKCRNLYHFILTLYNGKSANGKSFFHEVYKTELEIENGHTSNPACVYFTCFAMLSNEHIICCWTNEWGWRFYVTLCMSSDFLSLKEYSFCAQNISIFHDYLTGSYIVHCNIGKKDWCKSILGKELVCFNHDISDEKFCLLAKYPVSVFVTERGRNSFSFLGFF